MHTITVPSFIYSDKNTTLTQSKMLDENLSYIVHSFDDFFKNEDNNDVVLICTREKIDDQNYQYHFSASHIGDELTEIKIKLSKHSKIKNILIESK